MFMRAAILTGINKPLKIENLSLQGTVMARYWSKSFSGHGSQL